MATRIGHSGGDDQCPGCGLVGPSSGMHLRRNAQTCIPVICLVCDGTGRGPGRKGPVPATCPIRWSVRDRHGHSRTDGQACRPGL